MLAQQPTFTLLHDTYTKRTRALRAARELRRRGVACRVWRHAGVVTQPGRGIVSYCHYTITATA